MKSVAADHDVRHPGRDEGGRGLDEPAAHPLPLPGLAYRHVLDLHLPRVAGAGQLDMVDTRAALTGVAGLALLTVFSGWDAGLHSIVEWWNGLGETEGPWGLIAERNSLRENNESLPVVLARTFGDIDPALARNALSLAQLPLRAIWAAWLAMLAAIAVVWLACAGRARRAPPERGWLGMFALTAVLMLAATPVAWPHYFLWLLPAALFSSERPRLLIVVAIAGQLGMMIPVLRGLGCHMLIALLLFGLVARDLLRPEPTSDPRRQRARLLPRT